MAPEKYGKTYPGCASGTVSSRDRAERLEVRGTMTRRLVWLVATGVALAAVYGGMVASDPNARFWEGSRSHGSGCSQGAAKSGDRASPAPPTAYEEVTVKVQIPVRDKNALRPRGGPDGQGCPAKRVPMILGISFGRGGPLAVGQVDPKGPAAKAGMRPGDLIAKCEGEPIDCPRTLALYLRPHKTPTEVELTLRRPKEEQSHGKEIPG